MLRQNCLWHLKKTGDMNNLSTLFHDMYINERRVQIKKVLNR